MIAATPLYLSPRGGSITCFIGDGGRIFLSCVASHCLYSSDLHSAKAFLDNLEFSMSRLPAAKNTDIPAQRKTTLWNVDGELQALDMVRILDRISYPEIEQCDLSL